MKKTSRNLSKQALDNYGNSHESEMKNHIARANEIVTCVRYERCSPEELARVFAIIDRIKDKLDA